MHSWRTRRRCWLLGERDLRDLRGDAVALDVDVDVGRASLVPAGVDGSEGDLSVRIRGLDAAEVGARGLSSRIPSNCRSHRTARFDVGAGDGCAVVVRVHDGDREGEGRAGPVLADIAANEVRDQGYGPTVSLGVTAQEALVLPPVVVPPVVTAGSVGEPPQAANAAALAAPMSAIAARRPMRVFMAGSLAKR